MLVYDLNSPSSSSLESLSKWYKLFKEKAPILDEDEQDFCVVVVGNKLDLTAESDGGKKEKETLEFLSTFLPLPPPPPDTAQSIPIEATNGDALAVPSPTSPNFGTMTSTTGFSVYHTPSSSFRQSHAHTTSASTASNLFHTPRSSSFSPSRPESRILSPTSTISERTISPSRARNGTRDSSISRDRSSIASTIVPPPKPLPPPPPILYHASAKTAENVKEAFESVVLKCLLRREKEDREAALSEIANGEANGVVDLNAVKGKGTMKEKCCS
jgi:Ras-related protein Rab-7A